MLVDASALTGEPNPQKKSFPCSHPENPLETSNLALMGTQCLSGTATCVVIFIGDSAVIGQLPPLPKMQKPKSTGKNAKASEEKKSNIMLPQQA